MKGDFSRLTFKPRNHYRSVRLQQGRVSVDADWNEQVDIDLHRDETTTLDVVGRAGAPLHDAGFQIAVSADLFGLAFAGSGAGAEGIAVGERATILAFTTGAVAAQAPPAGVTAALRAVHAFAEPCAVGDAGTILRRNAGTWEQKTLPGGATPDLRAVHGYSATGGCAVGKATSAGGTVFVTADGGQTWTAANTGNVTASLDGLYFVDATHGWAVGEAGSILFSADGGLNWAVQNAPAGTTSLRAVDFAGTATGYAVGDGATIVKTTDGGTTWVAQAAPAGVTADLRAVRFVNANVGLAAGDGPVLLATSDGGATWTSLVQPAGVAGDLEALAVRSATEVWVAGTLSSLVQATLAAGAWTLTPAALPAALRSLSISAGRLYVDGILCENDATASLGGQPDPPVLPTLSDGHKYVAYLDVSERLLTALDRPAIREVALGGPDTAARTRTVWQVGLAEVPAAAVCSDFGADWTPEAQPSTGTLRARSTPVPPPATECLVPLTGGFQRLENQLYRVEVLDDGPSGVTGTAGLATYTWSRENGCVAVGLLDIQPASVAGESDLTLAEPGKDAVLGFSAGFLELTDEERAEQGRRGVLVEIDGGSGNVVRVKNWPGGTALTMDDFAGNPIVRRWEDHGPATTDGWITLEDGVEVQFGAGQFSPGDFWTIPARTVTADIEWDRNGLTPVFRRPDGTLHHYAALALLQLNGGTWSTVADCRPVFPPLTDLRRFFYVGGDAQEKMPDPGGALVTLDRPLEAGVDNGLHPVQGASIKFTVKSGGGQLTGPSGSGTTVSVPTGADGIAPCTWAIDSATELQWVEATLRDDKDNQVDVPIHFTAQLSRASDVRYTPGAACKNLAGETTVQDAIDRLAALAYLAPLSGDGQWILPGQAAARPVVVQALNSCGDVDGGSVHFHLDGAGTLPNGSADDDIPLTAGGLASLIVTAAAGAIGQLVVTATLTAATSGGAALPLQAPAATATFTLDVAAAASVSYAPGCDALTGVDNVQDAIDTLCKLGGGAHEPGIHVTQVKVGGKAIRNDQSPVPVSSLLKGIDVVCDQSLDPISLKSKPTCRVTLDVPYPLVPDDIAYWSAETKKPNIDVFAFQPLILDGSVAVGGPGGKTIRWQITSNKALQSFLPALLAASVKRGRRTVLAHLTLKGNFIWGKNHELYLDGDDFAKRVAPNPNDWRPPSGDGRPGGDFDLWFWLGP
jgi:photosystem II stability/assembly factor-like uncharacterized protein